MTILRLLPLLIVLCCSLAAAQPDDAEARMAQAAKVERDRIELERKAVAAKFDAEQKLCYQRFAVTGCIENNKARRRELLADLKRQEILLNDVERRRKAGEELRKLEDRRAVKADEKESRQEKLQKELKERVERATEPARRSHPRVDESKGIAAAEENARHRAQRHAQDGVDRETRAADAIEEAKRYEAKQRAAAENKATVLKRNEEKASKAKPLPAP